MPRRLCRGALAGGGIIGSRKRSTGFASSAFAISHRLTTVGLRLRLLLSIELELRNERHDLNALPGQSAIEGLLCEVEEIGRELIRRGTKELAEG